MPSSSHGAEVQQINQTFYDSLWANVRLIDPARFNTWPLVKELATEAPQRLEVGAGMRPRLPIEGTCFADISTPALSRLADRGGHVAQAPIAELPYPDDRFDLVCALDIIEHVEDDQAALNELCRVARPGATLLMSMPLHPEYWTLFDELVGHYRRYEPAQLRRMLDERGIVVAQSAGYGMKPKSSRLVDWGMDQLQKNPRRALWWYNRVFMPLGLWFQKPLALQDGLVDTGEIGEVFMVCRLAEH